MHPSETTQPRAESRALPPPAPADQVAKGIAADDRLVHKLQRVYRFSATEAADYLQFCRENPIRRDS